MENHPNIAPLRETISRIVGHYLSNPSNRATAVGVVAGGESQFFGFGRLSDNQPVAPDENTLFEIGSITKVFTGILLAEAVRRGEVRLEGPVQKHLPDGVQLKSPRARREMTLEHLATHRSGLPRVPAGFFFTVKDRSNPYASYHEEDMHRALSRTRLKRPPGTRFAYSNFGMGLLGHILARVTKRGYEELVIERICRPLGMDSTVMTLSPELQLRLAPGHTRRGKPTSNWDLSALAGAGALRSSVHDMLLFLEANLGPSKSPLRDALQMCQEPHGRTTASSVLKSYAVAVLAACLGLIIQWAVPVRPRSSGFFLVFALPLSFAARRGGFGAGLLAMAISGAGSYALWRNSFGWVGTITAGVILSLVFGNWSLLRKRTGLGWIVRRRRGQTAFRHHGGTGGYRSFAAVIPETRTAVVVLSNSANSVGNLGWWILDALASHGDGAAVSSTMGNGH